MKKYLVVLTAMAFLLLACETCDSPIAPPPPDTTTTVPEPSPPPVKPPRVDQPFTWDGAHGFSLFAGLILDEQGINAIFSQAFSKGRNTARVCGETEYWPGNDLYPRIPRNLDLLDSFLDTVARIPGAQVLLMPNCTLKGGPHDDKMPLGPQYDWNIKAAKVAAKYKNVAIEVVNEPGRFRAVPPDAVNRMINDARNQGVEWVGADDGICKGDEPRHAYRAANFISWHPCRRVDDEPWDPSRSTLEEWMDAHGSLVLSETVAWDDDQNQCNNGLRTCDKERIDRYQRRCNRVPGCVFFFHSEDGLAARVPFSWMAGAQ